jgi:diguanylate cyclase (GGDEF)-like protein
MNPAPDAMNARPEPKRLSGAEPMAAVGAREILTAVGEVLYDWSIADDAIRWGANAIEVLKVDSLDRIATGRGFAKLLDPANLTSRHDAILNAAGTDDGHGVAYQVQYSLLPGGAGEGPRLWIEDIGRWYSDETGRPVRAHGVLRVINERYEREQRLAFLSRYDELTGYFNRSHLLATLGDALLNAKRFRTSIAFMIVAVDNFRAINEAYGFDIADQIFAAVARRIKSQLREGDAIGRYSGNKLGLILMSCDEGSMHAAAERFHAAVRDEVIVTEAGSVAVTASIGGVALPRHGRTTNEAMSRAQEALHLARFRGHGHFVAYSHSAARQAHRQENAALSSELVEALNERRLRLAFQPVVEVKSRKPVFYEALLRLERANGSILPAGAFIALAERLNLVRLIDHRVLDLTLDALAGSPDGVLSFNISAETAGDSEWLAHLSAAIAGRRDLAERLIVEITESAVIRNLEEASHFVAMLHDLGCRVAIDDFGAGFSSFRNLRSLDVDIVKIDGGFIEHLPTSRDDQIFVKTLIDLARNFGIRTVAEWCDQEQTAAILADWGIDYIQGNLTGPALVRWPYEAPADTVQPDVDVSRAQRSTQ